MKETNNIYFEDKVYVLVNIGEDFLERRSGPKVYEEIKKSLGILYDLKIINLHEFLISKAIQKVSRVYLSKYFLNIIYKFNRQKTIY